MAEIGLISDTHGLLRAEAVSALEGCELIVHAGDVGPPAILDELSTIAPVYAVRGNTDIASAGLPPVRCVEAQGLKIEVIHDLKDLEADPSARGVAVVVSGHTHVPKIERRGGVLFVNPGSAGPRRFRLPISVARLRVESRGPVERLIEIVQVP